MSDTDDTEPGPLADIRVIDLSTVIAGPQCARYLADFGADVIKVERTGVPDTSRNMGWIFEGDGDALWSKWVGRNKRCIELNLKDPSDKDSLLALIDTANVLIENFRPGKLEALGLDPEMLLKRNPKLVIVRVSGFGQSGPYRDKPGFASIAEALSGFAAINGSPADGPAPPPIALTDDVTGLAAAFSTMVALHSGVGQVVDVSLIDSIAHMMGPLMSAYKQSGYLQPQMGSQLPYTVPRGSYKTGDGKWVVISASSDTVGRRVMALLGKGDDPRVQTFAGRIEHRDEVHKAMQDWVAAHTQAEVIAAFAEAQAAVAPVFTMADIDADPHYQDRRVYQDVDGITMQGLIARLSKTPGRIKWAGRRRGADTQAVLSEIRHPGE